MEAAHYGRTTLKYALWVVISATFLPAICLAQDARQVAQKVLPSVVVITTYDSAGQPIMQASGFFVTENTVATNSHVIEGASEAKITLVVGNANSYSVTGVVALNQQRDLVLLKVANVRGVPLTVVSANQTEVGEEIYAVGNPKGFAGTISAGIVSSFGTRRIEGEDLLQVTTPISPGSSGGPVGNKIGEVIGIADASVSGGQNLNFAVPAAYLVSLITQIGSSQPLSFVTTPKSVRAAIDSNDWVLIDSTNDVAFYYAPKHIERSGAETVQAWVKHVPKTEAARLIFMEPDGDEPPLPATFAYVVWKEEYNCRQSSNRHLSLESYDNHGKRLRYTDVPEV